MPATSSASRGGSASARNEIIEMLKTDHKRAKKNFRDFEKLDPDEDAEQCRAIVEETCAMLTVHARLEEECFYPQVRQGLEEPDLVDEAEVEHQTAKDLIAQLQGMSPGDEKYAARFTVLGEYIQHHVKEEEGEMFPQVSRAKLDWDSMLRQMTERRAELTEELMPDEAAGEQQAAAEDEANDVPAVPVPSTTSRRKASGAQTAQRASAKSTKSRPQAAGQQAEEEE